jgi:hypothetical protein
MMKMKTMMRNLFFSSLLLIAAIGTAYALSPWDRPADVWSCRSPVPQNNELRANGFKVFLANPQSGGGTLRLWKSNSRWAAQVVQGRSACVIDGGTVITYLGLGDIE